MSNCSQILTMDAIAAANVALLYLLFVSLGMTISIADFRGAFKNPKGVAVTQLGQFGILPLLGWGFARAFQLTTPFAVGLVAVTTAPGGAISNIIATFYQADIPLSVAATATSSILAIGFMPLNQYIYLIATDLAPDVCLNVSGIILSAAIVVLGTFSGLFLKPYMQKRKWYKGIKVVFLVGSLSGLAIIILGFVSNLGSSTPITALPRLTVISAFIPCVLGTAFGYISAAICKLPKPSRVTVALEVGIQNKVVAISALAFIFPAGSDARAQSFAMPILYALFATVFSFIWVGIAWTCGSTNLPPNKGFFTAFKMAREKANAERDKNVYGENIPVATVVTSTSPEPSGEQPTKVVNSDLDTKA